MLGHQRFPGGKDERYKLFKGCGVCLSLPHTWQPSIGGPEKVKGQNDTK